MHSLTYFDLIVKYAARMTNEQQRAVFEYIDHLLATEDKRKGED